MGLQETFAHLLTVLRPVPLPAKCICLSDLHAGAGPNRDPLRGSGAEAVVVDVLEDFFARGYWLLKNGDWWDVWRGGDLEPVFAAHPALCRAEQKYRDAGREQETEGNHEKNLVSYPVLFLLKGFGKTIFMDHGSLWDWPNCRGWKVGRFAVWAADNLGIVSETSPHPANADRHAAVRKMRRELAEANPTYDFLWGHTHFWCDEGNDHNSGSSLVGVAQGFRIEEGNFIKLERS